MPPADGPTRYPHFVLEWLNPRKGPKGGKEPGIAHINHALSVGYAAPDLSALWLHLSSRRIAIP